MIRTDCMRGDAGVGYHLQKGSYDLRDARRDCYTSKQKQKKHGGSTRRSTATSESDLPENQIPAAVFKGCPISIAARPPARLFPYVVPVSRAGAGVSKEWAAAMSSMKRLALKNMILPLSSSVDPSFVTVHMSRP